MALSGISMLNGIALCESRINSLIFAAVLVNCAWCAAGRVFILNASGGMMQRPVFLTVVSFFLVTGCEMETPPPAERPAQQNPIMPAAAASQISESTSTTTTTVEGNTRRTVTESSSVSVNAGGLLGAITGGSAPAAANTAQDYSGQWRVSSADNRECRANLVQPATPNANGAVQMQGCFGDLFGITRWTLRGSELLLSDAFGNKQISLRATGVNRLDGGGVTMWR